MQMGWGSQAFFRISEKLVFLREIFLCCQMPGSKTNEWPWPEIQFKLKVVSSPHPHVLFIGLFICLLRLKDEAGLERDQTAPWMLQLYVQWPPSHLLFFCLHAFLRVCTRLSRIRKRSLGELWWLLTWGPEWKSWPRGTAKYNRAGEP